MEGDLKKKKKKEKNSKERVSRLVESRLRRKSFKYREGVFPHAMFSLRYELGRAVFSPLRFS